MSKLEGKTKGKQATSRSSSPEDRIEFVEGLKRRWMATVDAIVDPLMLIDKDFKILQANRALAQQAKRDIKEVIGSKCYEMFAARKTPCPGCQMKKHLQTHESTTFELKPTAEGRYFEVNTQPITDNSGQLEGSLHIYRDRTLAHQLQTQLIQNEKLASIGLLAGGIAHELNNPLGGILLFSQMLLRTMEKTNTHYQDVEEIESAAKRCKSIVENLLDFARQQPALIDKKSHQEQFELQEVMGSALRFCNVGGAVDKVDIIEDMDAEGTPAVGNRNKLTQVFLNLIQNAVQAMPSGGRLTLKAYRLDDERGSWSVGEIIDTGVGIPNDQLKKIFDPFFTSKSEGEGTGLGLSICHGIVQDVGGFIEVESKLHKGSCFRVLIPRPQNLSATGS